NDFGLHDFRDTDAGSMLRVKGSDTLCPVGPGLVTDWDFRDKHIRTLVNGEVKQSGNTNDMVWDPYYLVADLARTITLLPGDIIRGGTPAGSRPVGPGDVVTVEVEGLGALTNRIVERDTEVRYDFGAQPSQSEEVVSTALGGDWEWRGIRKPMRRSEEHTSELQSRENLVCRLLLEKKKTKTQSQAHSPPAMSQGVRHRQTIVTHHRAQDDAMPAHVTHIPHDARRQIEDGSCLTTGE